MNRREILRLGGAALLFCAAPGQASAQARDSMTALIECIDHHRKYRACFATKFRTGFCDFNGFDGKPITESRLFDMLQRGCARLEMLSYSAPTAALLYHVREEGSVDIFLIDPTGPRAWERVDADIAKIVDGLRVQLAVDTRAATRAAVSLKRDKKQAETAQAVGLDIASRTLLPGSVGQAIVSGRYERLLILPSGAVGQIPFPALELQDGRQLVDQASVILLADHESLFLDEKAFFGDMNMAAEAMTFSLDNALSGHKLMVGNPAFGKVDGWQLPPLPGAEAEISSVATEFAASDVLVGKAATRKAILATLGGMQERGGIAYFATHGISDAVNPMDGSFLAVAGGVIRGQQIRKLRMPVKHPLVVMSACQSGLGKTFGGGGYGLARAWYAAGAGQVVGSLWNVSDEGTNRLMTLFARQAVSGRGSVEYALRRAMLDTRDGFSDDPAIWASFVSFGNPSA